MEKKTKVAIGTITVITIGGIILATRAKAAPEEGITIQNITGKKLADGSVQAYIKWMHYKVPALLESGSFARAETSIGRMENGVWNNYYMVGTSVGVPPEGKISTIYAYWAKEAVATFNKGLAGFRCYIIGYTVGWQEITRSDIYTFEDVVLI